MGCLLWECQREFSLFEQAPNRMEWAVPGIEAGSENPSPLFSQSAFIEKNEATGAGVWLRGRGITSIFLEGGGCSIPRTAKDGRKKGRTER